MACGKVKRGPEKYQIASRFQMIYCQKEFKEKKEKHGSMFYNKPVTNICNEHKAFSSQVTLNYHLDQLFYLHIQHNVSVCILILLQCISLNYCLDFLPNSNLCNSIYLIQNHLIVTYSISVCLAKFSMLGKH